MRCTGTNGLEETGEICAEGHAHRDDIDYYIPRAYARQPLPLREERTLFCSHISPKSVVMEPNDWRQMPFDKEAKEYRKKTLLDELLEEAEPPEEFSFSSEPPVDDTVESRLRGTHCDASNMQSAQLMVELVSSIFVRGLDLGAVAARPQIISSIDISHTALGPVGARGPPLSKFRDVAFFSDKERSGREKLDTRSFAFTCVAPLLWMPGDGHFRVTSLTCRYCSLGDQDAKALAFILRKRSSSSHLCFLENIDLSFNNITDKGADALKRSIKYNGNVKTLRLYGNDGIRNKDILKKIEARLEKNVKKENYLSCWLCLKWMIKGH